MHSLVPRPPIHLQVFDSLQYAYYKQSKTGRSGNEAIRACVCVCVHAGGCVCLCEWVRVCASGYVCLRVCERVPTNHSSSSRSRLPSCYQQLCLFQPPCKRTTTLPFIPNEHPSHTNLHVCVCDGCLRLKSQGPPKETLILAVVAYTIQKCYFRSGRTSTLTTRPPRFQAPPSFSSLAVRKAACGPGNEAYIAINALTVYS